MSRCRHTKRGTEMKKIATAILLVGTLHLLQRKRSSLTRVNARSSIRMPTAQNTVRAIRTEDRGAIRTASEIVMLGTIHRHGTIIVKWRSWNEQGKSQGRPPAANGRRFIQADR